VSGGIGKRKCESCKECKKIGFNDDDSVCIYCGSKETYRVVRPKATKLFKD